MSRTTYDDLEANLRELFRRQEEAMSVSDRGWDDPPLATVTTVSAIEPARPKRSAVVAVAAATLLIIGVAAIGAGGGRAVHVAGPSGSPARVHFETQQVTFDASALRITANGQTFTSGGSTVDVHSDPGNAYYQTLELTWREHGVEMRVYMYFAADAHDWWVTSIRTYNGRSEGDWIGYNGTRFRTPLGSAFTGDVDLASTSGNRGRLTISNLRLEAFRRPPVCATQTGAYAIESNEGAAITVVPAAQASFSDTVTLLDRAACTPVATPGRFEYRFTSSDPDVVAVTAMPCPPGLPADYCPFHTYFDLTAKTPGAARVHVVAIDVRTAATVAQTDVRVTAKR